MKKVILIFCVVLLCFPFFSSFLQIFQVAGESGLVAYWKFNEGSGNVVRDSSGNSNDGTVTGANWVNGIEGSALRFRDSNTYVTMERFPDGLEGNKEFTISVWTKVFAWPSATQQFSYLIVFGTGVTDRAFHILLDGRSWESGTIRANFWHREVATKSKFSTGVWYNWVFVYDKTQVKMYQNGTFLENIGLGGAVPNLDPSDTTKISIPNYLQYYNGIIDEIKIYNYVRSPSDILADFEAIASSTPSPSVESESVGYWKLDEGSGTIAHDSSGNGNTGTLTNGPIWTDGISGKALSFDGVNDYVSVPSSSSLRVTGNQITFEIWIKPAVTLSSNCPAINFAEKGDEYGFQMYAGDPRIWFVAVLQPMYSNWQSVPTTTANWIAGQWYNLVGTYDGSSIKVYVNGVLENSKSVSGNLHLASFPFAIGSYTLGTMNFFNGVIDEVKILNYARTATEILNEYNEGIDLTQTFDPIRDSFSFRNAGFEKFRDVSGATLTENPMSFTDVAYFVSNDPVYRSLDLVVPYLSNVMAVILYNSLRNQNFSEVLGGHCYGMSYLVARWFTHQWERPGYPASTISSLIVDNELHRMIDDAHQHQYLDFYTFVRRWFADMDNFQWSNLREYQKIKAIVKEGSPTVMGIWDKNREFYHAVVAYKVESSGSMDTVYISDPNKDRDTYVFDTSKDNLGLDFKILALGITDSYYLDKFTSWIGNSLILWIQCPVDLHVYDSEGRHVGLDSSDSLEKGFEAVFLKNEDYQLMIIPNASGKYEVELIGTGVGNYNLTSYRISSGIIVSDVETGTVSLGQKVEYEITDGEMILPPSPSPLGIFLPIEAVYAISIVVIIAIVAIAVILLKRK